MDYKYINQLLERYWRCETSIEEEDILKAFFSQKDVPVELLRYKDLFTYELSETKQDVLGEDFDAKILAMTEESTPVKAKVISMPQRLRPLVKAAAAVAIILTLGNALQVPFANNNNGNAISYYDVVDSMKRSIADPQSSQVSNILK